MWFFFSIQLNPEKKIWGWGGGSTGNVLVMWRQKERTDSTINTHKVNSNVLKRKHELCRRWWDRRPRCVQGSMPGWPCALSVPPGHSESPSPHTENQASHICFRSLSEIKWKPLLIQRAQHLNQITIIGYISSLLSPACAEEKQTNKQTKLSWMSSHRPMISTVSSVFPPVCYVNEDVFIVTTNRVFITQSISHTERPDYEIQVSLLRTNSSLHSLR